MKYVEQANSWEARAIRNTLFPFTDLEILSRRGAAVLERGEGPYVFDVHGRKFLDANSGLWNMVAGFGNSALAEAATRQFERLPGYHSFFGRIPDQAVALGEKLIEVSPFEAGKVFLCSSGSEANDTMVKILWLANGFEGFPQRRKILTRSGGYHGVTAVAASMTGKPYNRHFGLPLDGFIHLSCPHYWRFAEPGESEREFSRRLADELKDVIRREGAETIAGFFAEPVLGAGGVIPPPEGYFKLVAAILSEFEIPLIADEVICGFGRTGRIWGCESYGFKPDAIISSKNLTCGYFPLAAVILGDSLANRVQAASEGSDEFPHGFTASGHPVGCAVALEAIDLILNGGLLSNVKHLSPQFNQRMHEFAAHRHVGEVRVAGFMGALELVADKETRESFPSELKISERIAGACEDRGLICRPLGDSVILCPPFILSDLQLDELFDKLRLGIEDALSGIQI